MDDLLALVTVEDYVVASEDTGKRDDTGLVEQEDLMVRGGDWGGYVVPAAVSGTKTDTLIMETPLNIQVIPEQVLMDQQVISLDQAMKNVSGVVSSSAASAGSIGGLTDTFILRGFESNTIFRNGLRLDVSSLGLGGTRQMANVESVEVLKGSAAILYGRVEPGGMVNIITKQPLAKPHYSLQ